LEGSSIHVLNRGPVDGLNPIHSCGVMLVGIEALTNCRTSSNQLGVKGLVGLGQDILWCVIRQKTRPTHLARISLSIIRRQSITPVNHGYSDFMIPDVDVLIALAPEELAEVVLQFAHERLQNNPVHLQSIASDIHGTPGATAGYPQN